MPFRDRKKPKSEDLNLIPMMNLMTVLIPFLLSITAFSRIAIIEIALPAERGAQTQTQQVERPIEQEEKLLLTIILSDLGITIGARGGFLPTTFTQERWRFRDEALGAFYTVEVDTNMMREMVENRSIFVADAQRRMTMFEREEIILLALDKEYLEDQGTLVMTVYNALNEPLVTRQYMPIELSELKVGDTLYHLTNSDPSNPRYEIVENVAFYTEQPIDAYDVLLTRLIKVRQEYPEAPDIDNIIITTEDWTIFDKVVQVIDVARAAGFTNIQLAKLRI